MRSYLAAYLLKSANGGSLSRSDEPSQMQTIFVSIGKNRKVFPRDLARLFNKALDIDPKEIGNIKVLDNYSFIDIPQEVAPKAIEKLDGIEFRGRNITVNFARKKKGNSN
jgi:RNA recognition motif-containing protein